MRDSTDRTGGEPGGALELLGRRATLRLVWELRDGPLNFRALQEAAATNPAQLNIRLKELRAAGLAEHGEGGYRLSRRGLGCSPSSGPFTNGPVERQRYGRPIPARHRSPRPNWACMPQLRPRCQRPARPPGSPPTACSTAAGTGTRSPCRRPESGAGRARL